MDKIPPGTDLFTIPWVQPPGGQQSNFNEKSDLVTTFIVVISIVTALMVFFVGLRVFTKFGREETWKLDDWCASFTAVLTIAYGGVLIAGCPKLGHHSWDVSIGFLISPWPQKMLVTIAFMLCMCLFLGKICLLLLYWRIFNHIKHVRYQIYAAAFMALPLLACSIVFPVLAAPPRGKPWGTPNPKNASNTKTALGVGVVNLVVDLLIFYIPIPVVLNMNLNRKRKIGVLAIFLTGSIALVADVIVMYYRVRLYKGIDGLRLGMVVGLCSFVEAAISVICSSMPSITKFYKVHIAHSQLFLSLRSRLISSGRSSNQSSFQEIPEVPKKQEPTRKIKGPYSIPTTRDFSVAQVSRADDMELGNMSKAEGKP